MLRQRTLQAKNPPSLPKDPVEFAQQLFNFKPYEYQAKLLRDNSKRIAVRWSRQAGKTTCIASRAIWYAVTYPGTLTLIVAPSLRQSMIMRDRIQDFLLNMDEHCRLGLIEKMQRTVIRFRNGSRIVALPNNPQLLRGYTANQAIADEANFFKDDELVFYNVLYPMLSTTDGTLIAISTPWNKDSVFYHMCQNPDFSSHVVTCEQVKQAGLIKQSFIDNMRSQLPTEYFQREFMAEFVEDIDAWLSQSLIVQSIDSNLQLYDFQDQPKGEFYAGVDFGKEMDYSVVLLAEKSASTLKIVHAHRFPLKTEYASVIGYMKSLTDRWQEIRAIYADVTGVGNYIVEDMTRSGIHNVTGITFTIQSKEEMATILREKMRQGEVKIPYIPTRKLEDINLTAELNIEKCELMKTGHLRFSHPEGGHDDVFWSTALAIYASAQSPLPGTGVVLLPH
jgi:phage FluMu gp28-like protein